MTPAQVIIAATGRSRSSLALKTWRHRAGKRADLPVLDANPLDDNPQHAPASPPCTLRQEVDRGRLKASLMRAGN